MSKSVDNRHFLIVAAILNLATFLVELYSSLLMGLGLCVDLTHNYDMDAGSGYRMFAWFTIDSNVLLGLTSLIMFFVTIYSLINLDNKLPRWACITKLCGALPAFLTFFVTLFYLLPSDLVNKSNPAALYQNANLFYHLIGPLLGVLAFFFEKGERLHKFDFVYFYIPTLLYAFWYGFGNLFNWGIFGETIIDQHGNPHSMHDFYSFFKGNNKYFMPLLVLLASLGFCYLTYIIFNKYNGYKKVTNNAKAK